MITEDKFQYYRMRVLSKTNGRDVHNINGCLGRILNGNPILEYYQKHPNDDHDGSVERITKIIIEAATEIKDKTGIDFFHYGDLK